MIDIQLYDKLEFLGTGMEPGIYTFLEHLEGFEEPAIKVRKGDVTRNAKASLFKFVRRGAPVYTNGDLVQVVTTNQVLPATILASYVSFTNEPNMYAVEISDKDAFDKGVMDGKLFREDYIFPVNLPKADSTLTTIKHINKVSKLLNDMAISLITRGQLHDDSKLKEPEKSILDIMEYININEGPAPYGSEEYARRSKLLKPFLDHHYSVNKHHPEYYENYIHGMTILDVVEMVCDWVAAAERGNETMVNLSHSAERFCMSDQLRDIIANTYDTMGVKYK